MNHRTRNHLAVISRFSLLMLLSLISISLVRADGPSRPATPSEKQFYKSVQTVFAKAVPPWSPRLGPNQRYH